MAGRFGLGGVQNGPQSVLPGLRGGQLEAELLGLFGPAQRLLEDVYKRQLLGLSLILLAVVLFMPEYNGCKRWLVIPGFGTLQPSEIAKFAVVLVFSHIIALNHDRMKDFSVGVLPFALVLGVVAALMLLEPHLSGTVLILGIGAVLMFVGGTGLRWFLLAGVGGVGAIGAAVAVMPDLVPYAADRLRSWLCLLYTSPDPRHSPLAQPAGPHQGASSLGRADQYQGLPP